MRRYQAHKGISFVGATLARGVSSGGLLGRLYPINSQQRIWGRIPASQYVFLASLSAAAAEATANKSA